MNKIVRASASAGAVLLVGSALACARPGTTPDQTPTKAPTQQAPAKPRQLAEQPKQKKAPAVKRPVDVEAVPWDGSFGSDTEIQTFRVVVDEVWRHCLVNHLGGMACFDGTDAP